MSGPRRSGGAAPHEPETLLFLTARLLFLGTSDEATVLRRGRRPARLLGRAPKSCERRQVG
ncbi:hypothetical protein Drose_21925 [Dactylosporangium roseum]|uniref:Uncharacterized protein n=1 Tax=Dactylosporangium roseum TaxID=47989 RepID=A0ABY5YW06_9ACTN|nr:hypothetical protein [Dactylosporangium roseum]UWZ33926.1 hypothetical protein Drose_21925 [Dactylosporangium roseum]